MRRIFRKTAVILVALICAMFCCSIADAGVWEFGTSGSGQNPFTPRGYLVDTGKGTQFLSSPFKITASSVSYTGNWSGIDYIDAAGPGSKGYTFYAMTDRNPWPKSEGAVGYGKIFLFAYENGTEITDFASYVETPPARAGDKDPSGGRSWVFRISGLQLKPGSVYEFGYRCGMQANNGVTLAPAFNENGAPVGYISQPGGEISAEELAQYEDWKDQEYQFVSSWKKAEDGYDVNLVPMRFSVQTYADLSRFEASAAEADAFLKSVTELDLREGKYRQENLDELKGLLQTLRGTARDSVRYQLQAEAEESSDEMIRQLTEMMDRVKTEKPEPADSSQLEEKLGEAQDLLIRAGSNVGPGKGQYGRVEVDRLAAQIGQAKLLHSYSPQDAIDSQVTALQEAMDAVIGSRVREEQRIFYDKVTGIYLIAPSAAVPRETTFAVRRMGRKIAGYRAAEKQLKQKDAQAAYYSLGLYIGDEKIQPEQAVEIQMPVPDELSASGSRIYSVSGKGRLEPVVSETAGEMQFFKTKTVGDFVLAASPATEEEKAKARSRKFKELMKQRRAEQANQKIRQLQQERKKKEDYKDPVGRMLKQSENDAVFSADVKRQTSPVPVLVIAGALGAAAIAFGLRGLMEYRRRRDE